jgi:hypothetical protein
MGLEDDVKLILSFRIGDQGIDVIAEGVHKKGDIRAERVQVFFRQFLHEHPLL